MDFRIVDSILFVSTTSSPGLWHLYSLPSYDSIGRIIETGGGPLDLPMPLPCSMASFSTNKTSGVSVSLPINESGKFLEFIVKDRNIGSDWKESVKTIYAPILPTTLWAYNMGNDIVFQASIIPDSCKIVRTLQSLSADTVFPSNPALEILNGRTVDNMADIPSIITRPVLSTNGSKVAEIPGFSNEILIYEPLSDYYTSVRYPRQSFDENEIREMAARGISRFGWANGYDDFFAVVRNTISNKTVVDSSIDFISWEGNPLGTLRINQPNFRSFDIDLNSGTLYLLNADTDEIDFIDLSEFIDSLR